MEVALNSVVASSPASYSSSAASPLDSTTLTTSVVDNISVQGNNQNKQNNLSKIRAGLSWTEALTLQNELINKNLYDNNATTNIQNSSKNYTDNHLDYNQKQSVYPPQLAYHSLQLQLQPQQQFQQQQHHQQTHLNYTQSETQTKNSNSNQNQSTNMNTSLYPSKVTRAIETLNNRTSSTLLTENLILNYMIDFKNSGNNSIGNKIDLTTFGTNAPSTSATVATSSSIKTSTRLSIISNGTAESVACSTPSTVSNPHSILSKLNAAATSQNMTSSGQGGLELTLSKSLSAISFDSSTNVKTTTNCDSLLAIAAASLPNNSSFPINFQNNVTSSNTISSASVSTSSNSISSTGQASTVFISNGNGSDTGNGNGNSNNGNGSTNGKGNGNSNNGKNTFKIPSDILDDLASRFIINVPDMELNNLIRVCFQIELAHWFYLDFFCASEEQIVKLQPCGIKQFAMQIFQHIPFLQTHLPTVDNILEEWKNYKMAVPTFGAILLSEDLKYCLLVQSYFAKSSWGFPKGKVNENEDPVHCATREVYEETSYDITELIVPNDYIEAVINYQYTRLYIVRNVPLDTKFSPRTRNEIKCCDWFPIDSLPINKNDAISKTKLGINANSFFMILPFMKRLKKWVNDRRAGIEPTRRKCSGMNNSIIPGMGKNKKSNSPPISKSPPMGGSNNKNSNNQKFTNGNNSTKKTKQHQYKSNSSNNNHSKVDDTYALYNNDRDVDGTIGLGGGSEQGNGAVLVDLSNNKYKNGHMVANGNVGGSNTHSDNASKNFSTIANTTMPNDTNQRSKRQRHKSMGDLDGIKLSSFNNNNYNTNDDLNMSSTKNCHNTNISKNGNATVSNQCIGSNHKRNSVKIGAAGSNSNNSNVNNYNAKNIGSNSNGVVNISSKRQLFHSQSHNGTGSQQLQTNGDKNVNTVDIIRKEKQKAKGQKQQQQPQLQQQQQLQHQLTQPINNINNNVGCDTNIPRVRTKSQSEKISTNQQNPKNRNNTNINTNNTNNNNTNSNNSNNNQNSNTTNKNRLQRQQSLNYTNSSLYNYNSNSKNVNNVGNQMGTNGIVLRNPENKNKLQHNLQQSRSFTGMDLIAMMEKSQINGNVKSIKTETFGAITTVAQIERECRPRPVSVSLQYENEFSYYIKQQQQLQQQNQRKEQSLNDLIKKEKTSDFKENGTQKNIKQEQRISPTSSPITTMTTTVAAVGAPPAAEVVVATSTIGIAKATAKAAAKGTAKATATSKGEAKAPAKATTQINPLQRFGSGSNVRILRRSVSQQPQTTSNSTSLSSTSSSTSTSSASSSTSASSSFSSTTNTSNSDIISLRSGNSTSSDGSAGSVGDSTLKPFSPNNSWTNFTFTKNFISNVFC